MVTKMFIVLLFFHLLSFAASRSSENAAPHEFPWMVHLTSHFKNNISGICGAVLITPEWIITASHCLVLHGSLPESVTARFGRYNIKTNFERNEQMQVIPKSSITLHPMYQSGENKRYDFALIRLNYAILPSNFIAPIGLPDAFCDYSYTNWNNQVDSCSVAIVAGWGNIEETGSSGILKKAIMPIRSYKSCEWIGPFSEASVCAGGGFLQDQEACLGDSGGPLMCLSPSRRWYLLALTSIGDGNCNRNVNIYNKAWPGIYSRVCSALPWIHQYISNRRQYTMKKAPTTSYCSYLPFINNAQIIMPSSNAVVAYTGHYYFPAGTKMSFACNKDTIFYGNSAAVACQPSGNWIVQGFCIPSYNSYNNLK